MNKLDKTYTDLLQDILDNGTPKSDRTGTGTISVFGRQIRHDMKDGFPLLTTKKMPFKTIVTELLWFLRGDTNIKYLVDNNCHIWDGDAYKNYWEYNKMQSNPKWLKPVTYSNGNVGAELYNMEEFINKIKTDDEFAKKWGDLGKIYGFQWRNWGGWKDTKQTGFLHKTDNGWTVKWSDLHSFGNGTEWLTTLIQDSDQSLYSDEDEGKKVYYKNITLGYNESFCPVQVAKVIDDKFDKYVGGIDQISELIKQLKENPDSRRLLVSAWNISDLPNMVLPPCHYGFQVYTRELSREERIQIYVNQYMGGVGKPAGFEDAKLTTRNIPTRAISLMWNQRSVDSFLGLPFNIASYGLLLEILAKEVNMVPDELIGNLGDVHLYSNHIEQAREQIGRFFTVEERTEVLKQVMGEEAFQTAFDEQVPFGGGLSQYFGMYRISPGLHTRQPFPLPTLKELPDYLCIKENWECYEIDDIQIENYQSHPTIKAPLSN
jgi:thymidylate synthase